MYVWYWSAFCEGLTRCREAIPSTSRERERERAVRIDWVQLCTRSTGAPRTNRRTQTVYATQSTCIEYNTEYQGRRCTKHPVRAYLLHPCTICRRWYQCLVDNVSVYSNRPPSTDHGTTAAAEFEQLNPQWGIPPRPTGSQPDGLQVVRARVHGPPGTLSRRLSGWRYKDQAESRDKDTEADECLHGLGEDGKETSSWRESRCT